MIGLIRRKWRFQSIKELSWELGEVECTRLAGEPVLCATGRVLTEPFRGFPLRVFFVPRDGDTISTPGYIRCLNNSSGVVLPNIVVLSGRPEFLTELEPIVDAHPTEHVILDFAVESRARRNGDVVLCVKSVAVRASLCASDFGLAEEQLN